MNSFLSKNWRSNIFFNLFHDDICVSEKLHKTIEEEQMELNMLENLLEMSVIESKNKLLIDKIFEIFQNWTQIELLFHQLVAANDIRKACNLLEVQRIHRKITNYTKTLIIWQSWNEEIIGKVLESIENLLNFVEMGKCSRKRKNIISALNFMRDIEFGTLEDPSSLKFEISEIRNLVHQISLSELRPRHSVRQQLNIDLFLLSEYCFSLTNQ